MLFAALATVLALAAPIAAQNNMAQARRAYSNCLNGLMKADLKTKVEVAAFEAKLPTACAAQETSFRNIMIASDTAAGIKRADAEEGVQMEVSDMRTNTLDLYRGYVETNSAPQ